ncbi:MAG: choice-of-anchor Q domain-containing protein, partial [Chloroflexota bacterium]
MTSLPRRGSKLLLFVCLIFVMSIGILTAQADGNSALVVDRFDDSVTQTCTAAANDCSLRGAITKANAAAGADTITFDSTVFASMQTITLGNALPVITGDLTLTGPGASLVTISGATAYQAFSLSTAITLNISGVTIANTKTTVSAGAAIAMTNGKVTVSNSAFTSNVSTTHGAAISISAGTLTVSNSTFTSNIATGNGGAIYAVGSSSVVVTVSNSTFTSNSGNSGGAIANAFGTLFVSGSTFTTNISTVSNGGAIYAQSGTITVNDSTFTGNTANSGAAINNAGSLIIENSTFSNNTGTGSLSTGGGIYSSSSNLTLGHSTFSGNTSVYGAGIYNAATATIYASTFSGNIAATSGGGILNNGTLKLIESTVYGNQATATTGSVGGGGLASGGTLTLTNDTIAQNTAGLTARSGFYMTTGTATIQNTIIADNSTANNCVKTGGTLTDGGHNLDNGTSCAFGGTTGTNTSPLLDASGLQSNGGTTKTVALQGASLAINAGDNTKALDDIGASLVTDQRGYARIVGTVDIGAYESSSYASDFVVDRTDDTDVHTCSTAANDCSLRGAIRFANAAAGTDAITFETSGVFATAQTIAPVGDLPAIASDMSITSPDASRVTIDGITTVNKLLYVYRFGERPSLTITGLTLTRAKSGAITGNDGTVTVNSSSLTSNANAFTGGGISYSGGTVIVNNSSFTGNSAGPGFGGGAIATFTSGSLTVTGSTFTNNSSTTYGGAISNVQTTGTISNSTFTGNTATTANGGGAIYNSQGTLVVSGSTFTGNSGLLYGGGIYNLGGTLTVINSTLSGNTTTTTSSSQSYGGGGLYSSGSGTIATLINVTIANNTAAAPHAARSGAFFLSTAPTIQNSIIANNNGANNCTFIFTSLIDGGHNLDNGTSCTFGGTVGTNTDPLLNALELQSNGGSTQTIALQDYSPAINAGDNSKAVDQNGTALTTDQRGVGFARINNTTVDIGAYETSFTAPTITTQPQSQNISSGGTANLSVVASGSGLNYQWYQGISGTTTTPVGTNSATFITPILTVNTSYWVRITNPGGSVDSTAALMTIYTSDLVVDTISDSDPSATVCSAAANDCSLRGAISKANATSGANTISFDPTVFATPQTITLTSDLPNITDDLTIIGPNVNLVTISGAGSYRPFKYSVAINLTLKSLTIANGKADNGGAIYGQYGLSLTISDTTFSNNTATANGGAIFTQYDGSVTVSNSTFSNNAAVIGGVIYGFGSAKPLTISNSNFSNNTASQVGGVIYSFSTISVSSSSFSSNTASSGGAIFALGDTLSVSDSSFTDNHLLGSGSGGAILTAFGSTLINRSIFSGNAAINGVGGAIYASRLTVNYSTFSNNHGGQGGAVNASGTFSINYSRFLDNTADYYGGGLYGGGTNSTITGSTFVGNTALQYGGGGIFQSGGLTIMNTTISGNSSSGTDPANSGGGGLYAYGSGNSRVTIINSTIVNNTAALPATSGILMQNGPVTIQNSIVANNNGTNNCSIRTGGSLTDGGHNIDNGTTCNFSGTVGQNTNPLLGSLADNGGFTQTFALQAGSPAIDAGDNTKAVDQNGQVLFYDQRGSDFVRIQDGTVDIGAYETNSGLNAPTIIFPPQNIAIYNGQSTTLLVVASGSNLSYQWYQGNTGDTSTPVGTNSASYTTPPLTTVTSYWAHVINSLGSADSTSGTVSFYNYIVDTLSDTDIHGCAAAAGDCSLRGAITLANGFAGTATITFDPILFATPQTITMTANPFDITHSMNINGPGASLLTIDGVNLYRAFSIIRSSTTVNISGITVTRNPSPSYSFGTLSVSNSVFTGNTGGSLLSSGTLTVSNTIFTANSNPSSGGGGISGYGTITISNSTFTNNSASSGGAISTGGGSLTIINSTFSNNSATYGGAIYSEGGISTIVNSVINDNTAAQMGGGIYNGGTLKIINTTISGNYTTGTASSFSGGGALSNLTSSPVTIINSTIANNSSPAPYAARSGLWFYSANTITIQNSIVANNNGANNCVYPEYFSLDNKHNLENGFSCGFGTGSNTNPLFDPAGLQNNGGPTRTIALQAGSPAINVGDNTYAVDQNGTPLDTDQRGTGFARIAGGTVDLGAFETDAPASDFVVDRTDDADARACSSAPNDCTLRGAINLSNGHIGTDTITFDSDLFASPQVISMNANLPYISEGVNINGPGADKLTVSGGTLYALFLITPPYLVPINVQISDLTIANGKGYGSGGGIGVGTYGTAIVKRTSIVGNSAYYGGGINNSGTLTIIDSTIAYNSATYSGGGISNSSGTVNIINSTISGNVITDPTQTGYGGSGFFNAFGTATIINSTIAGNSAAQPLYAGVTTQGNPLTIQNSIVANNSANNCSVLYGGTISDGGHNLDNGTSCGFGGMVGQNTDPMLAPLGDNGGSTQTIALQAGSPAIDAGDTSLAVDANGDPLQYDQRGTGYPRVIGTVDIGAYEASIAAPTINTQPLSQSIVSGGTANLSVDASGTGLSYQWYQGISGTTTTTVGTNSPSFTTPALTVDSPYWVRITNAGGSVDSDTAMISIYNFVVDTTLDTNLNGCTSAAGDCSLRGAINLANSIAGTDTITFDPLVFATAKTITLGSNLPDITTSMNITGPGAALATINGAASYRSFYIINNITVAISGLTITNNGSTAVTAANGVNLTVSNSTFTDNISTVGGAIYGAYATIAVSDSSFSNNSAGGGSAIASDFSSVTISDSDFSNNSSPAGTGSAVLSNTGTSLSISNSTFTGNSSTFGNGGAVDSFETTTTTITDSTFSGNSAYAGGAIYGYGGTSLVISNTTFSANTTDSLGGAILNYSTPMVITDSTFSGNSAKYAGGAIYTSEALKLINSTLSGNTANTAHPSNGGGALNAVGVGKIVTIINSTIANNSAVTTARGGLWIQGATLRIQNSIVANNNGANNCALDSGATLSDGGHNLDNGTSCGFSGTVGQNTNPLLGSLGDNGGSTQTIALQAGSPAIDGGDT